MRCTKYVILCSVVSLFLLTSCDSNSFSPPGIDPGWQKSKDMYEVDDYTWVDLTSPDQLVGLWYGSKIINKPEIEGITRPYELLTEIKMIRVDNKTTLYVIEEKQYFKDAITKGTDWNTFMMYMAGQPTGTNINKNYPTISETGKNAFYGSAETMPAVRFSKEYWTEHPNLFPSFKKELSMKISEDGTKLKLQYSDEIQFVIGRKE